MTTPCSQPLCAGLRSSVIHGIADIPELNNDLNSSMITTAPNHIQLEMWANAQRDGRPAEYRWRPLFNAAVWLTPTTSVLYSNAAKTRNP